MTLAQICARLGWIRLEATPKHYADVSRLNRVLGRAYFCGRDPRKHGRGLEKTLRYETAAAIIRAIDLDPVDLGL